ncbi:MAG: Rieske (2Fe-2S) protein [Candidatus Dormibacteraeota bacterium]|nr:Rieske (2Fe-2S) protein [Candidatus Dormibacteraeota bacterium]MBV9524257.1 Rieske (2Fe-2S) protein [Candidatus Dormibacteraeota bacterium]
MSKRDRRLQRYIDALLKDRRPPEGEAGDDAPAMQLAAALHAAHPGSAEPSPEFVDSLARRLRHQETEAPVPMPQRRRFLAAAGLAAAAGIGAGFGIEHWREALTEPSGSGGTIQPTDGQWVAVTTVAALTPGRIHAFTAAGIPGFVYAANGELKAVSAVCTDQGCILNPDPAGERFVCPCHYATFSLDGTPHSGTAYSHLVTPLPAITVRANGDNVEVLVPKTA